MGQRDEENPVSEDEAEAEKQKLQPNPPEDMEMKKIPIKTHDAGYPSHSVEVIVGQDDPLIKSHHLKYLLFGFNGFVSMLGIALLSISIWIRADPEFWEYENTLEVDNFHAVCAMLIVASLVILVVGVLGCIGAASERRWMLILYMTLFGLIFLLELAAITIMWSAPYSKTISSELEKQIKAQIDRRAEDDSSRFFMDFIQEKLYCCGATGVQDYMGYSTPKSCVNPNTGSMFDRGCASMMLTYLRSKAGIVGGLSLPILLIQLLAFIASGCLIKSLEVESRYFMKEQKY